jgi:hypothetical protein
MPLDFLIFMHFHNQHLEAHKALLSAWRNVTGRDYNTWPPWLTIISSFCIATMNAFSPRTAQKENSVSRAGDDDF